MHHDFPDLYTNENSQKQNKMKLLTIKINVFVLILFLLTDTSCQGLLHKIDFHYQVPEMMNDGLLTGVATEAGIDTSILIDAVNAISKGKHNEVHSILIYKNNKLVFEEYFEGHEYKWDGPQYYGNLVQWTPEMRHPIMSCTQSITSACIGIAIEKGSDSLFLPYSFQFNIAGLGFERYGIAYELRLSEHHALFVQGGGSFPFISEEKEYGFGLHYKFYLQAVSNAKSLWLFESAYRNTFVDFNVRYMNLDGIHKDANFKYDAFFTGVGLGQTYVWESGFTMSYWLGYGPPIGAEFKWQDSVPEDGNSWAKMYKNSSGLDFGLTIGYSF